MPASYAVKRQLNQQEEGEEGGGGGGGGGVGGGGGGIECEAKCSNDHDEYDSCNLGAPTADVVEHEGATSIPSLMAAGGLVRKCEIIIVIKCCWAAMQRRVTNAVPVASRWERPACAQAQSHRSGGSQQ
jgi:hypothetical protein